MSTSRHLRPSISPEKRDYREFLQGMEHPSQQSFAPQSTDRAPASPLPQHDGSASDELRLQIKKGGELVTSLAEDPAELGQHLLIAVGISTLFGGGPVHIEGWLPGLTLMARAKFDQSEVGISISHVWPDMHARLSAWLNLEQPSNADALDLSFDAAHCFVVPDGFSRYLGGADFTLRCVTRGLPLWRRGAALG